MYTLATLCNDICLPEEVTALVLELEKTIQVPTEKLYHKETWEEGLTELRTALDPDPDGFKILACMLRCAAERREEYLAQGFSHEIYVETMKAFSRFVGEHMESFGRYGFDRWFWTVRQLSLVLFRIGELEYEFKEKNGQDVISLHIPSDAKLEMPLLRKSYEEAKALLVPFFPGAENSVWCCGSWLLGPALQELLPADSRILGFQRNFQVTRTYPDPQFKQWVYKRIDIPNEDLPENTSLQRKMKAWLLAGNEYLSGEGPLVEDPFL